MTCETSNKLLWYANAIKLSTVVLKNPTSWSIVIEKPRYHRPYHRLI